MEKEQEPLIITVINITSGLLFITALFVLKTFIMMLIYNWLIVPAFSLKEVGMISMYGLSFLTEFLGGKMNVFHMFEGKPDKVPILLGEMIFKYGLFLAIICIAHFLIIFP